MSREHRYVLVPEPAQDAGNLITGRWAFQRFVLRARGRPAHAGATLVRGWSAIREMARQIIAVEGLSEPERHVTLSVGVIHAGTFVNVVPWECVAQVLAVTPSVESFERVRAQMGDLRAVEPEVALTVESGPVRPLWDQGAGTLSLYERARAIARDIGFDPGHGTVGGGSDGNFTARSAFLRWMGWGCAATGSTRRPSTPRSPPSSLAPGSCLACSGACDDHRAERAGRASAGRPRAVAARLLQRLRPPQSRGGRSARRSRLSGRWG